ncbi:MAG TPA: RIP metalloprotease RseP [Hyphomicrobiaceae bacterium]|nr:RIP metalloprotease RseP [Hyphomicrobiaceae bacterium]
MELIQGLTGGFGKLLAFTLPFLFVLVIVVFIHELGHFLVARWCGVKVKAFSIGFGKEIFGFYDRYGTRWRFAWVPLGGYVKFLDDENSASVPSRDALARMTQAEREGAFQTKPLAARAAIVAAGPIANFLLAIAIFTVSYTVMGMHVTAPRVDELLPDGVAASAGFQVGDVILKIDGAPVETFNDMQRVVSGSADKELAFEVNRGGTTVTLKATPARRELVDRFGNKMRVGQIGIRRNATQHEWEYRRYGPIEAFGLGVKETFFIISRTLQFLQELVLGRESTDQLRGPIGIAEISGQVATLGIMPLLNLVALISVSIGLINLFPIPLLDGGHLLFYAIEAIRREPLSERTQEISFRIGLAIVLMLTVFVTTKDIWRIWLGGVG